MEQGLYNKYIIIRTVDGSLVDGNAFVLHLSDHAARSALRLYAVLCDNELLESDLVTWVDKYEADNRLLTTR